MGLKEGSLTSSRIQACLSHPNSTAAPLPWDSPNRPQVTWNQFQRNRQLFNLAAAGLGRPTKPEIGSLADEWSILSTCRMQVLQPVQRFCDKAEKSRMRVQVVFSRDLMAT